jgi:5-methylcytosine-specific restriction endonuclease McrA
MVHRSLRYVLCLLIASAAVCCAADVAGIIVSLADPAKLATLGERGANPRVQKITYWLETGRREGKPPEEIMDEVMNRLGWNDERGRLTTAAMLRNVDIAIKLGCTDDEGMEHMRHGRCAIVKNGPYAGDTLSVDHIVPRALYPQLDNVLANLELMPMKLNRAKSASFGQRQGFELGRFRDAGFIDTTAPASSPATATAVAQPAS